MSTDVAAMGLDVEDLNFCLSIGKTFRMHSPHFKTCINRLAKVSMEVKTTGGQDR